MSGHSKWATIKRAKGANDAKRGQLFTKLSKAITIAVQQGGGVADADGNPRLRLAIDAARAANMPKDNIERAVERAAGKSASDVEEVLYEGFGPGGFSVIVEAITDNKMRTTPEVKSVFSKSGGNMGNVGSVAYQFQQKGLISVNKAGKTLDEIFITAADSGAEDVEDAGADVLVYTSPDTLSVVRDGLTAAGYQLSGVEIIRRPIVNFSIADKILAGKALAFMEKLEDMDDVQKVYANFDIPDAIMGEQG